MVDFRMFGSFKKYLIWPRELILDV
jgi:hypothetical protein